MNLQKMIAELQTERNRLSEAILALERLSVSNIPRRGRPPRWLKDAVGKSKDATSAIPNSKDSNNRD